MEKDINVARRVGDVAGAYPGAYLVWDDVGPNTDLRLIDLIEDLLPVQNKVSRILGETKGKATDRDCAPRARARRW